MSSTSSLERAARSSTLLRWSYDEFVRLGDAGFLRGRRVELVEGKIIRMAPQRDVHSIGVELAREALADALGKAYWVRMQLPLQIGRWSGPEPDVAVVSGRPRELRGKGQPKTALLVVEVSDTTLRFDRRRKASLYAKAGIAEYWIVNLIDLQVEVHRLPGTDPADARKFRYGDVTVIKPPASIALQFNPQITIAVADLLP